MPTIREHFAHHWTYGRVGEGTKGVVSRIYRGTVPPGVVRGMNRVIPRGLVTAPRPEVANAISDDFLRERLAGRELGTWTLSGTGIDLLEQRLRETRPLLALEFGSGVSTLCLAHLMRKAQPDLVAPWVISIEQDGDHVVQTRQMLDEAGLAGAAHVFHAPLVKEQSFGATRSAYDLPHDAIEQSVASRTVGFVLVDGPAAEDAARVTTLPAVARYLAEGTPVFLDDALREGELAAARYWSRAGLIEHARYVLAESGFMLATARKPPSTLGDR